ncbi:MAG: FAD-dependent oxidoreductase, partial [Gammaproteobacteria bacterium]
APDLVSLDEFYIPVYESTSRSSLTLRTGLFLYAILGGLKSSTHFHALKKKHWPSLDGLKQEGLKAVYQYYDGRTDDHALTHAVMRSAIELGAESVIPATFVSAQCDQHRVHITYLDNGIEKHCQASALVNATGAWINSVLEKIKPASSSMAIDLVQGTHLVLDNMPVQHCFYLEAPQDKRAIFLMPWKNKTLLGTTETRFSGLPENVQPQQGEKDYLLEVAQHYFPEHNNFNVSTEFAGLRVLTSGDENNFSKPRDTVLYKSHDRVINIYGGKLTTYRSTAERVIKKLRPVLPPVKIKALTENIKLKA